MSITIKRNAFGTSVTSIFFALFLIFAYTSIYVCFVTTLDSGSVMNLVMFLTSCVLSGLFLFQPLTSYRPLLRTIIVVLHIFTSAMYTFACVSGAVLKDELQRYYQNKEYAEVALHVALMLYGVLAAYSILEAVLIITKRPRYMIPLEIKKREEDAKIMYP